MATYTPLNSLGTKNGMSEITEQTIAQRAQIQGRDARSSSLKFGVASSLNIFPDEGENIKLNAFNAMLNMYEGGSEVERYQGSEATLNPDFTGNLELGYDDTPVIDSNLDSLEVLADKPSYFGPNLESHSIDASGEPDFKSNLAQNSSSTTTLITSGGNPRGRGFGNEEGHTRTIGSYMRRRWSIDESMANRTDQYPQLGEYKNHRNLTYSDVEVRDNTDE